MPTCSEKGIFNYLTLVEKLVRFAFEFQSCGSLACGGRVTNEMILVSAL